MQSKYSRTIYSDDPKFVDYSYGTVGPQMHRQKAISKQSEEPRTLHLNVYIPS